MSDKHLSTQFDSELSAISNRVLEMGGLVESQVIKAVHALTNFSSDQAAHFEHARAQALEVGVVLLGKVLAVGHAPLPPSRIGR